MAGKLIDVPKNKLLFKEGDTSRTLYFLKTGILRVFKIKASGEQIDLGTIKSGEVLGEMSFLDGDPRSASAEAIQDCKVIEIPFEDFQNNLKSQAEWMNPLIRSITGRLRTANNKIKQLESAAVSLNYGKTKTSGENIYEYVTDKTVASFLLSLELAQKNGVIEIGNLKIYYQYLLQENPSKLLDLVLFFKDQKILDLSDFKDGSGVIKIGDSGKLVSYLQFMTDEAKKEDGEKLVLSENGFSAIQAMNIEFETSKNPKLEIHKMIQAVKLDFKKNIVVDSFTEMFKQKIVDTDVEIVSPTEAYITIDPEKFNSQYPNIVIHQNLKNFNLEKTKKVRGK